MSGIVISFWEYCKLNFHKVLDGTVAECRWGKLDKPEHEEYVINGVRYIVTAKHIESETMTFLDKIKRFLGILGGVVVSRVVVLCRECEVVIFTEAHNVVKGLILRDLCGNIALDLIGHIEDIKLVAKHTADCNLISVVERTKIAVRI